MISLNNQQRQLIFDHCVGLTSEKEAAKAEALIAANPEAAELYSKLRASLAPLESAETEPCPDYLAESTVGRLKNLARSSHLQLEHLLAAEQTRHVTSRSRHFWRNLGEIAAIAAVIMFISGVLIPTFRYTRQKSWQLQCQMQLSRIWQGINHYSSDHNGELPALATTNGTPWWKVGYQGKENCSNTRHMWILVKGGYVNPADFICSGKKQGQTFQLNPAQVKSYNDFPGRKYVTYSLRIMPGKSRGTSLLGHKVLMSDLNPLFEKLPQDYSRSLKLQPGKNLLTANSINHNRRGQNVLFGDGGVKFVRMRRIGTEADDIFTLKDTPIYQGVELPSSDTDVFLAP